jgi:anti-sigma regulatory factor (Ser/Thr protein kinase)
MSKIELVIESCYENIDLIGTCIESLASELFDDEQSYQIKVCVYEAVTNCVKHGYQGFGGHKIWVTYQRFADHIVLDIADCGLAMDPQRLENTTTGFEIDPENPSEGGMGLKIIKLFMDGVSYQSTNGVNHLTLVKYYNPLN